ncbi:MAG: hypothetical protein H6737_11085 [Alphaproteobacteria bacterium]|nr:hypothetical protein [Alphaproteobacteria bacterium]
MRSGIELGVTSILEAMIVMGGYHRALVCTEDGLLVASAGDGGASGGEDLAAFTSLFDTVVERATRDLAFRSVDEVTLLDPDGLRLVIRPLPIEAKPRLFLVVRLPKNTTWRRHTNQACSRLVPLLEPLTEGTDADAVA